MAERRFHDGVIVVGAGLAGLSAALAAAPRRALVLAPPLGHDCSTAWAQGGVAAAVGADDHPALHARDTVAAGAGLVDAGRALALAEAGPETVRRLAGLGAPFDRDAEGAFVRSLEAAHSRARVVRVGGDQAGRAIMDAVAAAALGCPSIEIRRARLRGLLQDSAGRVRGVLAEQKGRLVEIVAPAVLLATGGLGGLYAMTTNPPALRGDGLALAALAGAEIADPEFVQFHPTALDVGLDPAPLATEALRGEGAVLVDRAGRPLMGDHPQRDLAPRDVVARAVEASRQAGYGAFLDARGAVGERFPALFPSVFAASLRAGVDPRQAPMPVAAAAHYHMGGIAVDAAGRSSLPGLHAAGECASSGVHGANRLASNSLLEAAAFGARAGEAAAAEADPATRTAGVVTADHLPAAALATLREAMTRHAGVLRDRAGLTGLLTQVEALEARYGEAAPLVAARLIAAAALARTESRGAHHRLDFPAASAEPARTRLRLADVTRAATPAAA